MKVVGLNPSNGKIFFLLMKSPMCVCKIMLLWNFYVNHFYRCIRHFCLKFVNFTKDFVHQKWALSYNDFIVLRVLGPPNSDKHCATLMDLFYLDLTSFQHYKLQSPNSVSCSLSSCTMHMQGVEMPVRLASGEHSNFLVAWQQGSFYSRLRLPTKTVRMLFQLFLSSIAERERKNINTV